MCNACWSNPDKVVGLETGMKSINRYMEMSKLSNTKPNLLEAQGPTKWSSDDLRFKYRDEDGRTIAWTASKEQRAEAAKLLEEQGKVIPVVRIDRHPFHTSQDATVADENKRAIEKARARNRVKVYALDIKALWTAHRPPRLRDAKLFALTKSLHRRLDVDAIKAGQHQVQSVSPFRAFEPALVPAVTKVKALVGTLKVVKMLRRRGSVKVDGKNQLDDQELAAAEHDLDEEEKAYFHSNSEQYEIWGRVAALCGKRYLLLYAERSENFMHIEATDPITNKSYEVEVPRTVVDWVMGNEFNANQLSMIIDRIATVMPEADEEKKPVAFNRLNPITPPTSFTVCGRCWYMDEVPGTTVFGDDLFKRKNELIRREKLVQNKCPGNDQLTYYFGSSGLCTGMFYRDSTVSSTDSIMVVLSSSLELLLLHPLTGCWNTDMILADKAPEEMTNNAISDAISPYEHRDIDSNVSKWIPNAMMILTGAAMPTDYKFNYPGHRRFFDVRTESGFRQVLEVTLQVPNPVVQAQTYGVTEKCAVPNVPTVWPRRYTYHSEDIITGLSPRDFQHYLYVITARDCARFPDPLSYTILMRGYEYERVRPIKRSEAVLFEEAAQRLVQKKLNNTAVVDKLMEGEQRKLDQKARKDLDTYQQAMVEESKAARNKGKLEQGTGVDEWEKRLQGSVQVDSWLNPEGKKETWTKWQAENGALFYKKEYPHYGFQWDQPINWGQVRPVHGVTWDEDDTTISVKSGLPKDLDDMIKQLTQNPKFVGMLALKLGLKKDRNEKRDLLPSLPMYKFFEAGDRIEARYKGGSQFWPGRVMRDNDDQTYDIVYDLPDMYEKKVPVERVRKIRTFEAPATVPLLELGARTRKEEDEEAAKQRLKVNFAVPNPTSLFEHNMNWRLLKPDRVPKGFVSRCKKPRIGYAMPESPVNSFPKQSIVGLLDPAVFAHENDIADLLDIEMRTEFISNITVDSLRYAKQLGGDVPDYDDELNNISEGAMASQAREIAEFTTKCFLAVTNHNIAKVEEYLDYGVLPQEARDEKGNTLLHKAVQQGDKRIAKFVLRRGADINAQNLRGHTVLHYAFYYNFVELGNYLISKGADPTIRNADGLTCYEGLDKQKLDSL